MIGEPGRGWTAMAMKCLVVLLSVWLTGCSGCQSPPVVDLPAASLDLRVAVLDVEEMPSDGKVIVVMQFTQNGSTVEMASNVALSCNGVPLVWNGLLSGHAARVPIQAIGMTYTCSFTRGATTNTAVVTVPPRPVFVSPTIAGAVLVRTSNFTIHYVAGTGTSVRGDASDGTNSQNNSQPDDGTFDNLDVSAFNVGAGTLSITRTLEDVLPGTGFQSAKTLYDSGKRINITWN
jgi:hypothetical protein